MIDFRYHLVSLVSVFLALAVGIVLGAGPLRGEIAQSINTQVEQLRDEKNQLRSELTAAEQSVKNRDAFTEVVLPDLVAGRLTGRSVALVVLPGVDGSAIDTLVVALRAAGATVTTRVDATPDWTDPESDDVRRAASRRLAPLLTPLGLPNTVNAGLARALLIPAVAPVGDLGGPIGPGSGEGQAPIDATSTRIIKILADAGLVDVRQEPVARAGLAVVLAPSVELDGSTTEPSMPSTPATPGSLPSTPLSASAERTQTSTNGPAVAASDSARPATTSATIPAATLTSPAVTTAQDGVAAWAALAYRLDRSGNGAVVSGPASAAEESGVLNAVRADSDIADQVSTVDLLGSPMGDVATVMALQEQLRGASGAYGFGRGATDVLPDLAGSSR